jgi:uncharacterized protein (DUF885 family)
LIFLSENLFANLPASVAGRFFIFRVVMQKRLGLSCFMLAMALVGSGNARAETTIKAQTSAQKLADMAERFFEAEQVLNPLGASYNTGEARFDGELEIAIAPAHRAKSLALTRRTLAQLKTVKLAELNPADQMTYAVLQRDLEQAIETEKYPRHLLPFDQYGSLPVQLAQFGGGQDVQPLRTVKNYDDYLKRLNKLPVWVDQAIANMRIGMARGVVQPRALIESGLPSIKKLTDTDVEKSVFNLAITNMPATFSASDRKRLTAAYQTAASKKLIPAVTRLYTFLEREYLPKTRASAGVWGIPGGADWYAFQVKNHTTTDMTPDEIHALGLKEVARIRAEMQKIQAGYKFEGTVTEFLKWHEKQPQFRPFKTEQEVLDAYAALNKKITPKLSQLFGRAPKAPLEIRPEPELTKKTASDHYSSPAVDGSRPGVFYAVIDDATKYRTTGMATLFLHEGQPGHHYHVAMQQELPLPKFRKHGWVTAYGEGWALYAETLGHEMGLYEDPNSYLGHLQDELLRAVRLVTDTGLHAKKWTREQTMQYMMDNEGVVEAEAKRATERYMAWPAQALAYKIGALKIQALRERAKVALGDKFSLKDFHDLVLSDGVLPLNVLEQKIDGWILAKKK